jgi:hypothetical protein
MKTRFLYLSLLVVAFFSCDNSKEPDVIDDNSSKTYPVELRASNYQAPEGCYGTKMEADTLYIINTQNEFISWIPCADVIADIDWEKQTLLVTWDRRCNADSRIVENKFAEIAENVFRFEVTVEPSVTTNAAPLFIYTIVPKLPKNAIVGFNINLTSNGGSNTVDSTSVKSSDNSIAGTKWKLAGFVSAVDGSIKEPEPSGNNYFTVYFAPDGKTLTGFSSVNELFGEYEIDIKASILKIKQLGGTKIKEQYDGKLFVDHLLSIHSFSFENKDLKLYHNELGDYLLFKKQ